MRYVLAGMFVVLALAAATLGHDPPARVAANEGDGLPLLRRVRSCPVLLPHLLQDKKNGGKKLADPPTINFPGTMSANKKAKLSFFACGTATSNFVFGIIFDPKDENWIWPGITVSDDWVILFDSIPSEYDMRDDMVLRVEMIDNGELSGTDRTFTLDDTDGLPDCNMTFAKKKAGAVASTPSGTNLKITRSPADKETSKKFTIQAKTDKASAVYGVLIPDKDKLNNRRRFKTVTGQAFRDGMEGGKTVWTIAFDLKGVPPENYELRVRHVGAGESQYWDRKPILVKKKGG